METTVSERRLILRSFQSPGDIVMLSAAIRDLHAAAPGQFQTDVRTSADALFENNPHITRLGEGDSGVESLDMHYPLIHQIFDDETSHELLRSIRPDVLVKGGTTPHVVGREVVESYGGRVCVTGAIAGVSTTLIQSRMTAQVDSASSLSELASEASHVA